jgi:HSP20 family protein
MNEQSETITQLGKEGAPVKLLPASTLFDRIQDLSDSIARRAFEIFNGRGGGHGHDLTDWLRAESEFLYPLHLDIAQSDYAYTVYLEVPGFRIKDLDVGVEPHRLTIRGTRAVRQERATERTVYTEQRVDQIFRSIDLPFDADPSKLTVTLLDGVLELSMPKTSIGQDAQIEERPA